MFLLLAFCAMQSVAQILFKYGSLHESKWLLFFISGNVFGASSIWILMLLYKHMNVNVALALAGGAAFVSCQLALALFYRSRLTSLQMVGILGIAACMALVTLCEQKPRVPAGAEVSVISTQEESRN